MGLEYNGNPRQRLPGQRENKTEPARKQNGAVKKQSHLVFTKRPFPAIEGILSRHKQPNRTGVLSN